MSIVLTFDDGLLNTLKVAYPIMQRYNLLGSAFIITGSVGGMWKDKPLMSWKDISILHESGWSIESHTVTHPRLTDLSTDELNYDLHQSKIDLKSQGYDPICIAYPYGSYNRQVLELAKNHYKYGRKSADNYFSPHIPPHQIPGCHGWKNLKITKQVIDNAKGRTPVLIFHEIDKSSLTTFIELCKHIHDTSLDSVTINI